MLKKLTVIESHRLAIDWKQATCYLAFIGGTGSLLGACASDGAVAPHSGAERSNIMPQSRSTKTIYAVSCSFESVKIAVANAKPPQTVVIPPGDCDWGADQLTLQAGVALKGAGSERTILRRTAPIPHNTNTYLVRFDCRAGGKVEFSGITLVGANLPRSQDRGLGLINGCVDFVVSHSKFTKFVFAGVEVRGSATQRGVIYDSEFVDNYNSVVHNLGYGIVVYGDGTWPALELGSANAVFVEDNYFSGNRHHIAANNGARYVFRNNVGVATDLTKDYPQVDAHGLSSSPRGTRSWEVYNNKFSAQLTRGRNFAAVGMRGGDGIVFGNTYTSNIAYPVALLLEGASCGSYPVKDQIRQAYIQEEAPHAVSSRCEASIALGRDYFLRQRPGYQPYQYPHPLRSITEAGN